MKSMMKRTVVVALTVSLLITALLLAGCGEATGNRDDGVLTIVCTNFAGYDFARQITKTAEAGSVQIIQLGKPGQDMHSYEPTAADITTISRADLVICLGSAAEPWLDATLAAAMNQNVERVNMTEVCALMAETPTEGMDTGADHDHDHENGECCGLIGGDEHVWLAVENAIAITAAMEKALVRADAARAGLWAAGSAAYTAELSALREDYRALMAGAVRDTILIADRYPFAYLVRELGLTCYAAFPGCSSETSASFATQTFLIEKTEELALPFIFMIDGSDGTVAEVIAKATGASVLTLDSMQVVHDREKTYVGIMRANLEQLKQALT